MTKQKKTESLGGRPPTDLKKLGAELIEWSFQADALNLIGFSSPRRFSVTRLSEYADKDKGFSEALQLAKENIAQNRFRAANANEMIPAFYTRSESLYDPVFHKHDHAEKDRDAQRKKEIETNRATQVIVHVSADGLASGTPVSAKELPAPSDKSSK